MILILGFILLIGLLWLIYKYWFFKPEVNIFYLVMLFNTVYRSISVVGKDDDKPALTWLLRPIEKVKPFTFKFQKLVTKTEAEKKGWSIVFEILNDKKVIVEREEMVPGWRAIELHAVGVEFVTASGVDISLVLECAYQPLDGDGPVLMVKTVKNWSAFADVHMQNLISAWGRSKNDDKEVLKVTIDQIMTDIASDILKANPMADPGEKVRDYLNQIFAAKGFKLVNITLYKVMNGPQSQDVKDLREAVIKADLELQKADKEARAAYKKGLPAILLEKKSLDNKAGYTERVNLSVNQTAIQVAEKLTNLQTLVIDSDGFNTGAFTGSKVAGQQKGGGNATT